MGLPRLVGADGVWTGSLTRIEEGRGYWVNAIADGTITLTLAARDSLAPAPSRSLAAGWNMIGYTSLALEPSSGVATFLGSISGKWVSLYRYTPGVGYESATPGRGFATLDLGRGYLLYLSSAGTLVP